jgi:hypothetical protein
MSAAQKTVWISSSLIILSFTKFTNSTGCLLGRGGWHICCSHQNGYADDCVRNK